MNKLTDVCRWLRAFSQINDVFSLEALVSSFFSIMLANAWMYVYCFNSCMVMKGKFPSVANSEAAPSLLTSQSIDSRDTRRFYVIWLLYSTNVDCQRQTKCRLSIVPRVGCLQVPDRGCGRQVLCVQTQARLSADCTCRLNTCLLRL